MTNSFDHERVSESLPSFLEGTMSDSDAVEIEQHLASCEECRLEAAGLSALRTPIEASLTDHERLTLEHKVMAGIADDSPATVTELPRRQVGARVAQVLGAAAVVAVIATFFYFGSSMGGSDSDEMGDGGGDAVQETGEDLRDADKSRENRSRRGALSAAADSAPEAGGGSGGGAATEDATTGYKSAPKPRFTVADEPYTAADLQKLGESSLASVTFAHYYTAGDADGRDALLDQLVESAEASSGSEVSSQVYECGLQVLDTDDPTIPTFGALAEVDGNPVLVLGFVWSRTSSGPMDRYMVWAWERDDCSTAVDFVDGRVETAG
jgi:anti-sigma factor RsiW